LSRVTGKVEDYILVLWHLEEKQVGRGRYPVTFERPPLEREGFVRCVLRLRGRTGPRPRQGVCDWGCLVLKTHMRSCLAEEARHFDWWLRV
jgi:hypothetical protein